MITVVLSDVSCRMYDSELGSPPSSLEVGGEGGGGVDGGGEGGGDGDGGGGDGGGGDGDCGGGDGGGGDGASTASNPCVS